MKKAILSIALTFVFALTLTSFNKGTAVKQTNKIQINKQVATSTVDYDFGDESAYDNGK